MLETLISIAQGAGSILMKWYGQGDYTIRAKEKDQGPVTNADEEADAYIRKRLSEEFPQNQILSEEHEFRPAHYQGRVWMVDPLDGTSSFIHGKEGFSVILGLAVDGVPELGVVYHPAREELFYAVNGKGAFHIQRGSTEQMYVNRRDLSHARVITSTPFSARNPADKRIEDFTGQFRTDQTINEWGAGVKICKVAQGIAEFYLSSGHSMSKWDTCGPQVILEEAGGRMTFMDGTPLDYTQESTEWPKYVLSSNRTVHDAVVNELGRKKEDYPPR